MNNEEALQPCGDGNVFLTFYYIRYHLQLAGLNVFKSQLKKTIKSFSYGGQHPNLMKCRK